MKLKTFLLQNKNSRKIFGQKEIKIIIKQLDGLNLTQSEKNRLSRDIRVKFKFIKECARFKDEFMLKKNQDIKRIIEQDLEIILKDEMAGQIDAVLLAGSFVDKALTKRSDIDMFVVFKKDIDISVKQATGFRKRLLGKLNEKTDLQVFNIMPIKVKESVAKNHRVIFKSKHFNDFAFFIKNIKEYQEFKMRCKNGQNK